jgi:hypothetical protein
MYDCDNVVVVLLFAEPHVLSKMKHGVCDDIIHLSYFATTLFTCYMSEDCLFAVVF